MGIQIQPAIPLTDPRFNYRAAVNTDIKRTWARFGWAPPSSKPKEPKNG